MNYHELLESICAQQTSVNSLNIRNPPDPV